jgi:hypothetical protein
MRTRWFFAAAALAAAAVTAPAAHAQPGAKPGPEIEHLKVFVGTWDTTMTMGGAESKGTAVYKMDLGGLWLASTFEGEAGGRKFAGRGFDTYDAGKKKYVSVWMDSMSTSPMVMEGTIDHAKKAITMTGEGPGMDGKLVKHRTVTEVPDHDTMKFRMYVGDAKEPAFTILYKRKK